MAGFVIASPSSLVFTQATLTTKVRMAAHDANFHSRLRCRSWVVKTCVRLRLTLRMKIKYL